MFRSRLEVSVALLVLLGCTLAMVQTSASGVVDPVLNSLHVDGAGTSTYPAFVPETSRYAITTSRETDGTVTVNAVPEHPGHTVSINGRVAPGGTRTLSGLEDGDEISVIVTDGLGGSGAYGLVYLPAGFPLLERVVTPGENATPGHVLLTLAGYEAAVDLNGVPIFVRRSPGASDLKPAPGGGYSVARPTSAAGRTGFDIVRLDSAFEPVGVYRTQDRVNTDNHDAILMPDGSAWLMAYERRSNQPDWDADADPRVPDWEDAVIQHVAADGDVMFEWNSRDHVPNPPAESVYPVSPFGAGQFDQDYAHINSFQLVDGGESMLASFRHLSSVFKIAVVAHDGYEQGEVIWKLGGRYSSFDFLDAVGEPLPGNDGGPCAQHTAYEVAPNRVLTFDNGADGVFGGAPLCVDATAPTGSTTARVPTRAAEWELDADAGTARLVWSYEDASRYAIFAGSAQRLPVSGHTLIGWASSRDAVATEVDETGRPVWELRDPNEVAFSYRAFKAEVPDTQRPVVSVTGLADGTVVEPGTVLDPQASCTDRGGSMLDTCVTPAAPQTDVPGTYSWTVTATDGAGNSTQEVRRYTVRQPPTATPEPMPTSESAPGPTTSAEPDRTSGRPDVMVRVAGSRFIGRGDYAWSARHRVGLTLSSAAPQAVALLRVVNTGQSATRFTLTRTADDRRFRAVALGSQVSLRTPLLRPGEAWSVRIRFHRTERASVGGSRLFVLRLRSTVDPTRRDAVAVRVRATR